MSRRFGIVVIAVAAVLLAAAAALPALRGIGQAAVGVAVPIYVVERSDFVRRVHADGNLEAVDATMLGPPPEITRGLKIAWLEQDGTIVKAGDVVIRFDPILMQIRHISPFPTP